MFELKKINKNANLKITKKKKHNKSTAAAMTNIIGITLLTINAVHPSTLKKQKHIPQQFNSFCFCHTLSFSLCLYLYVLDVTIKVTRAPLALVEVCLQSFASKNNTRALVSTSNIIMLTRANHNQSI